LRGFGDTSKPRLQIVFVKDEGIYLMSNRKVDQQRQAKDEAERRGAEAKGRQGRDQVDAAVLPDLRRQCRALSAPRCCVQPRQLHAHAGDAEDGAAVVANRPVGPLPAHAKRASPLPNTLRGAILVGQSPGIGGMSV
jgi:hypothetical protein